MKLLGGQSLSLPLSHTCVYLLPPANMTGPVFKRYVEVGRVVLINYGPDAGGNTVLLKGQNFNPFNGEDIDNNNDTFCNFEGIGKVKATIINSTKATCVAPPNYLLDVTYVEMTLND